MSTSDKEILTQRIQSLGVFLDLSAWAAASPDETSKVLRSLRRAQEGIVASLNELGICTTTIDPRTPPSLVTPSRAPFAPSHLSLITPSWAPVVSSPPSLITSARAPISSDALDTLNEPSSPGSLSTHSSLYLTPEARTPVIQTPVKKLPPSTIHQLSTDDILLILTYLTSPDSRTHQYSCDVEATSFHLILSMLPQWLTVALAHPFLWGNILRLDSDTLDNFRTYLERSNGAALHLVSRVQKAPFAEERMQVWELALANLKRCSSLAFEISPLDDDPRPIRSFLTHSADAVERLSLHNTQHSYRQDTFRILPSNEERSYSPTAHYYVQPWDGIASNFTTLQLHACQDLFDLHAPSFANLVTLNVSNTTGFNPSWPLASWMSLLGELMNLRHLSIIDAILVPRHCEMAPTLSPCSCATSVPYHTLNLTHLSTIYLTSHLLIGGAFLSSIQLGDKIESSIHLHSTNGPENTAEFLRKDPDHFSFPLCHALLALPTDIKIECVTIRCLPDGFSIAFLHPDGAKISSVAVELTTLGMTPGEMQAYFSTILHLIGAQVPNVLCDALHLDYSVAVPTGLEMFTATQHFFSFFPKILSWRTDCLTFEQLAPNIFRPGRFRPHCPFPHLLRIEIFGPVFNWLEERPSLFQTVCLTLRTSASHSYRFFAIDDQGSERSGGCPWEKLRGHREWHRSFVLSIRVSMDKGTVTTILEPDGYGCFIENTSAYFWNGDKVLKFGEDWPEASDSDE